MFHYWQVGIRVNQPTAAVTAVGNVFESELGHLGVTITGEQGIVTDNRVVKPQKKE